MPPPNQRTGMQQDSRNALLTLALFAAFADGHKADSEREAIRRIAESLSDDQGGHPLATLYQDVLLQRVTVPGAVAALTDPAHRQLAYEMAVCVCDADGSQSAAEQRFLADLRSALGLAQDAGLRDFEAQADALAAAQASVAPAAASASDMAQAAQLDQTILNAAILNGALELLPQSWASMAIIPLQMRLVYRIGQAHGVALDQGHIKEFLATAGIGMTSQYIEQFGRKLLGGLVGKALGKTMGKVGGAATGMAFSFATTYALGQLARRYYAGGRVMDAALLRSTYEDLLAPARQMQTQYLPQIRERAATLDASKVMALVRGG
ncbi:MAG: YcjF family protein [Giesbergeria sp.]